MALFLRRLVSTNKRRYQHDGYDLDLSYITPRIIAMGFPCNGICSLYRNPLYEVARLLEECHAGHYKVYNLCVERGYDPKVFKDRVLRVPMYDGQAPPLHLLLHVCRDAAAWLAADPHHVVAVHCKAGKGRTGAVVCALLLALDPNLGSASLGKTLTLWAERRTKDAKGLSIPSQRRFVSHFHELLMAVRVSCPTATAAADTAGAICIAAAAAAAGGMNTSGPESSANSSSAAPQLASSRTKPASGAATMGSSPAGQRDSDLGMQVLHLGVCSLLDAASVRRRAVTLIRLRFRGLPLWLLRDCTACVWWRPVGHHAAHNVCCVQTQPLTGCRGNAASAEPEGSAAAGGVSWAIRQHHSSRSSSVGNGARKAHELCLDLTGLAPLPSPPAPSPLPYHAPHIPLDDRGQTSVAEGVYDKCDNSAGAKTGPPTVAGDIKVQLFRGAVPNPPHDVFKGSVTQFSAWLCTSYLDPRVGAVELGRAELDKLSRRLRRWPGEVGMVLEYEMMVLR